MTESSEQLKRLFIPVFCALVIMLVVICGISVSRAFAQENASAKSTSNPVIAGALEVNADGSRGGGLQPARAESLGDAVADNVAASVPEANIEDATNDADAPVANADTGGCGRAEARPYGSAPAEGNSGPDATDDIEANVDGLCRNGIVGAGFSPPASAREDAAAPGPLSAADDPVPYEESHVNMYRLYNPNSGEHFYTSSLFEAQAVASAGWQWEGIGWVAPTENDRPVFRLYNPNAGDHHYTLSEVERDDLVAKGWSFEGIGWYSDSEDQAAVLRQYNPNAIAGAHNFTTSAAEDSYLGQVGWNREGVAWYATDGPGIAIQGFWLVTSAWGDLHRYWIDSSAQVAKGRFVETSEGSGWRAYATASGAVARDRYIQLDNYWYQTDSEGRLSDGDADRIISVSYLGGSSAHLEMFAKDSNSWRSVLSSSAILGTNGINKEREGDRKTPTGTYDITEGFGILENPGLSGIPYTKVHEYLWWSGAPETYNTMVDSRYDDPGDGEHLIEYSPYYNYALVIGYNREGIFGKGSAIFLHCDTGRSSTAGCVGVSEETMVDIMRNTTAHTKICIY